MPIHGEFRHLTHHKDLAISMGMTKEKIFVTDIGEVLEISGSTAKVVETVPSGQLLVDGLGVGDVGNVVLRDRKHLSEDGLIIASAGITMYDGYCQLVSGPEIISRGFVFVRESDNLMEGARKVVQETFYDIERKHTQDKQYIKARIRDDLRDFIWQATKRNPMIFPILVEA